MALGDQASVKRSEGVLPLEWLKDNTSKGKVTLSGSKTLLFLLGKAEFQPDVRAVLFVNRTGGDVHYNPLGTADATFFTIADGEDFTIHGGPSFLLGVELFAAPAGGLVDLLELIEV